MLFGNIDWPHLRRAVATYSVVWGAVWLCLALVQPRGGYVWDPMFINPCTAALFTLLAYLTARLLGTNHTLLGLGWTALFLILFCPGADSFFDRDEAALVELCSQCIVPFFIMQYMRVSRRNFRRWYFLMALMGVFCSYTHNGITVPLCAAFVWLSFQHRKNFFHRACWPMVVGFVIGTALSMCLSGEPDRMPVYSQTLTVLRTLWDTKVFVLGLAMTAWVLTMKNGRRLLSYIAHRHYVLAVCLLMSLLTMPFAPLGIENAVTGICFFTMLWTMAMSKQLIFIFFNRRL